MTIVIREHPVFEFHVSRSARDKYNFDKHLFSSSGNTIFANFHAARLFAQKINDQRDLINQPEQAIKAGEINAMGLIDEMLHHVIGLYRRQVNPRVFNDALEWIETKLGHDGVENVLVKFTELFPPVEVYKQNIDAKTYLASATSGIPNRAVALEEILLLWLANLNPAFQQFLELFDDKFLKEQTAYLDVINSLHDFFESQPNFGPGNVNLMTLLRRPAIQKPDSLTGQLQFLTSEWGILLEKFVAKIHGSLDLIKEETKPVFWGPPPTYVAEYEETEYEPEQFSPDLDWMPRLVLIAKSTLVWFDQLSKKYERAITKFDEIPDEELDQFARWGFTGLWLIGIWQRSRASQKIKQITGNPEAESSAYSLFDYEIADELGGYTALANLKQRCWQRGIRLACDMVPNHTGIDSNWIRNHPDWFISLPYSPFPGYSFNGSNLSNDPRYGIFIEDNYYNRTDAAVVFKREDYWTGDVKYIYHGNDGTSMPWNDTAQLNYLHPQVREAVIQKIINVARIFPVIRFDAAMTLTKRHYQRLWYPQPGQGGDIPSRSEHGMTKRDFNSYIKNEFWREVVDRVAEEVPESLLLAEAFWLMEGYFVRTLGMHRVYNSAFMNMLKNEENSKFRQTVINTIQFNPEILKRYVNFMNNPDEDTAVQQFGKGDKYFGVCVMMVTLPGLPMFGHGQIEGFSEKYGMEYRRAYLDEHVDSELVRRHEVEIFPLMKKRYLFAEVENFLFYDFVAMENNVNEDVFAYSNSFGDAQAVVIYHNNFSDTHGWIHTSVSFAKSSSNEHTTLSQKTLGEALALNDDDNNFCIFRDQISGLEYIRNCREIYERGLFIELGAYKYFVFTDFRRVEDNHLQHYAQVADSLNGHGASSIETEIREIILKPLLEPFDAFFNQKTVNDLVANRITKNNKRIDKKFLKEFEEKYFLFLKEAREVCNGTGDAKQLAKSVRQKLEAALRLQQLRRRFPFPKNPKSDKAVKFLKSKLDDEIQWTVLSFWLVVHEIGIVATEVNFEQQSRSWIDEWLLYRRIERLLQEAGADNERLIAGKLQVNILTMLQNWFDDLSPKKDAAFRIMSRMLKNDEVQKFLKTNRFDDVVWFNKERFADFILWLFVIAIIQLTSQPKTKKETVARKITDVFQIIETWQQAEIKSEYQLNKFLESLKTTVAVKPIKPKRKKRVQFFEG